MKYSFSFTFILIIFLISNSLESNDKIAFLDIQTDSSFIGDAIVIHSTDYNGKKIFAMIDTGKNNDLSYLSIEEYLWKNEIHEIEWLLLTHFHDDHMGGLDRLMDNPDVVIKNIYMKEYKNIDAYKKNDAITVEEYRAARLKSWKKMLNSIYAHNVKINYITGETKELLLGNYLFKILNVEEAFIGFDEDCAGYEACNENTNSVILVGKNNNRYYYLNGDIDTYPHQFNESGIERQVNAYNKNRVDKWVEKGLNLYNIDHFDVYKVSHHGVLYNNILESFVVANPDICIACSKKEALGANAKTLIDRIKKGNKDAEIYFSGTGTVIVNQDEDGVIDVVQEPDYHLKDGQWVYNLEAQKCLYAPSSIDGTPTLGDCDDSDYAKWIISPNYKDHLQFRSKFNIDWCLHIDNVDSGAISMKYCEDDDAQSYFLYSDEASHKNNTIRPIVANKCLDQANSKKFGGGAIKLNFNECDGKNRIQNKWSVWNVNPSDSKIVWIQNKNSKKCIHTPDSFDARPIIQNCDDTENSKWLISSSSKGYIRSVAYPYWCINLKDTSKGTITNLLCENHNDVFEYPTDSSDAVISPLLEGKCLGLLASDSRHRKLNLNTCDTGKSDQHWEILENSPVEDDDDDNDGDDDE